METKNLENQQALQRLYDAALKAGAVHNKKQFAEFVGINRSVLINLLNGKVQTTDRTLFHTRQALSAHGISIGQKENQNALVIGDNHGEQKILDVNAEGIVKTLTAEMAEQRKMYAAHVDRLLGIIEKMQN